jgi:hypothetical protein
VRIQPGTQLSVTATDKWLSIIQAQAGFTAGNGVSASVGNMSVMQLWNPNASGKTALVRLVEASVNPAAPVDFLYGTAAIANNLGTGLNLYGGGSSSVCQLRWETPAAAPGTTMTRLYLAAGTPMVLMPDWFALIPANRGLNISTQIANIALYATFIWWEF